jgi:hypothetical protein
MTSTRLRTTKRAGAVALALAAGSTGLIATAGTASATNWDAVAQCESGGNWGTSTGNGFSGGLQFTPSTWAANGGSGSPENASRAEQIRVAESVKATQGMGAWPVCGAQGGSGGSYSGSNTSGSGDESARSSRSTKRQSVSSAPSSSKSSTTTTTKSAPKVKRQIVLTTDLINQDRADVEQLQKNLVNVSNFDIAIDGHYGPQTEGAVKQLQKRNGLTPDGEAGPQTLGLYNNS